VAAILWARLDDRYPWVGWLWRWGISVCSLSLGLATLFVFRRGLPHVGWIVGYLLLLWVIFAIVTELRAALEQRGRRLVVDASEYVILSLCHGLLLFDHPQPDPSAGRALHRGRGHGLGAAHRPPAFHSDALTHSGGV